MLFILLPNDAEARGDCKYAPTSSVLFTKYTQEGSLSKKLEIFHGSSTSPENVTYFRFSSVKINSKQANRRINTGNKLPTDIIHFKNTDRTLTTRPFTVSVFVLSHPGRSEASRHFLTLVGRVCGVRPVSQSEPRKRAGCAAVEPITERRGRRLPLGAAPRQGRRTAVVGRQAAAGVRLGCDRAAARTTDSDPHRRPNRHKRHRFGSNRKCLAGKRALWFDQRKKTKT